MTATETVQAINWGHLTETIVHGTIKRRVFETDTMTIIRYEFAPDSVFPMHQHPEAQVTLIVSGALTFDYGDRAQRYRAGDIVVIPGNVAHEGRVTDEPTVALCIVVPPRSQSGSADSQT
ncbi:MAG: cupin domain-containing protein [Acidobacteria bacterium]|nr:cupin domain-containing protein [Acidobacteriota bacterium]